MMSRCVSLALALCVARTACVALAGNAVSKGTGHLHHAKGDIGHAAGDMGHAARDVGAAVNDFGQAVWSTVTRNGGQRGGQKDVASKVSETLGGLGSSSENGQKHGEHAGLDDVTESMVEFFHEAFHAIPASTRTVEDDARATVEGLGESVSGRVSEGVDTAWRSSERAAHRARDLAEQAREHGKKSLSEGEQRLLEEYQRAKGKAAEVGRKASEKVEDLKTKATTSGREAADEAGRASTRTGEAARQTIESLVGGGPGPATAAEDSWRKATRNRPGGKWVILEIVRLSHLLSYAIAYGASFWNTFISTSVISPVLSPKQLTVVQGRLLPVYYRLCVICNVILLLSYCLLHPWGEANSSEKSEISALTLSLLASVTNLLFTPLAMWLHLERQRVMKEERVRSMAPPSAEGAYKKQKSANEEIAEQGIGISTLVGGGAPGREAPANVDDELEVIECIGVDRVAEITNLYKMASNTSTVSNMICFASLTWHAAHLASRLVL